MTRASGLAGVLLASLAAGCGGSGSGGGSDPEYGAQDLFVVDVDADGLDGLSLNTPINIEFSEFLLPETIRHDTVQIRLGPRYGIQAFGDFKVSGNVVTFYPRLPTKADLSDAGLQPLSQYRISILGSPKVNHVQAYTGRPLVRTFVGDFATAATTSPDLFTTDSYKDGPIPSVQFTNPPDVLPKGPEWNPGGSIGVPTDTDIQVVMNRVPLLPSTITPNNISLTMIERLGVPQNRPIQGTPRVEQSFDGVSILFDTAFPLADQARYVLRIENRVTDLTGAYDVADNASRTALRTLAETSPGDANLQALYASNPEEFDPRTFLILETRDEPTKPHTARFFFDGTDIDEFGTDGLDKAASTADFNSGVPGAVAAVFTAAGGNGTLGDFLPTSNTTLNTNSPSAVNGIFNYRTIDIPSNVTVVLAGTLPASLLSLKATTVRGTIGASGTAGQQAETNYQTSSLPASLGGAAGAGGGKGADNYQGSLTTTAPTMPGSPGPNGGGSSGGGGSVASSTAYMFGGGGAGSGHKEPGFDGGPGYYPSYASWNGAGGIKGPAAGIQPTSAATGDGKNFYNSGVGGGGGGASAMSWYYPSSTNWRNAGAGGGGGGGAILLKSAGDITLMSTARILALGGAGGAGGTYYYCAGGGGGGSGGSVAIYANGRLDVNAAIIDTSGGAGGAPYASGWGGPGGKGGGGWIQLEDQDGTITNLNTGTFRPDKFTGSFDPTGTASDAPSVFVSNFMNIGVFDPIIQTFAASDFTQVNFPGCTITYELQMAREDPTNFGHADKSSINTAGVSSDLTKASQWAQFAYHDASSFTFTDITGQMNGKGYQFYRIRITFTLKDGQKRTDPVPYLEYFQMRVLY